MHETKFLESLNRDEFPLEFSTRKANEENKITSPADRNPKSVKEELVVRPHPHAGATYPNGTLGLVIDPSMAKFQTDKNVFRGKSCKVDNAIDEVAFDVFRNIRSGVISNKISPQKKNNKSSNDDNKSTPRILCMVYTHSNEHDRVKAIVNTWGKDCDGFFAASNVTDLSIHAINLTHKGPEAYSNMWQKIRSMWAYAHDHFLEDYDYFHISGDDSVVVVDNMKAYFQGGQVARLLDGYIDNIARGSEQDKQKQWLDSGGKRMKRPLWFGVPGLIRDELFALGGCGYTINRELLRRIGIEGGALDTILAENEDFREDVFFRDLALKVDTVLSDTRDDTGAFRYLSFSPSIRFGYKTHFPYRYQIPDRRGMSHFSNETVALHLKDMDKNGVTMDEVMYRTYDLLSGKCDDQIFKLDHKT